MNSFCLSSGLLRLGLSRRLWLVILFHALGLFASVSRTNLRGMLYAQNLAEAQTAYGKADRTGESQGLAIDREVTGQARGQEEAQVEGHVDGRVEAQEGAQTGGPGNRPFTEAVASATINTAKPQEAGSSMPWPWRDYPRIPDLSRPTGIFRQFLFEVQENKKYWAQGQPLLPISLYVYRIKARDNIFSISAKTSVSVESIATLNRIEHPNGLPSKQNYILLPNNSGIFLPQDQSTDGEEREPYQSLSVWEQQLRGNRADILYHRLVVGSRVYFYYPRSQFNLEERRYFLDNVFRSPVQRQFYITSPFGMRRDPITGRPSFHDGIDIRSAYGAPIYSIANGIVLEYGESRLYGLYVKIRLEHGMNHDMAHDKSQVALYGHLSAVLVHTGQRVNAGEVIGNSGQSGRITGPHLHLTIFENGKAVNPAPLFKGLY